MRLLKPSNEGTTLPRLYVCVSPPHTLNCTHLELDLSRALAGLAGVLEGQFDLQQTPALVLIQQPTTSCGHGQHLCAFVGGVEAFVCRRQAGQRGSEVWVIA